ncbi:hypothetical protein [Streptomyces olivaceus]|uniref:hypothetical protein n=1 Tax=Streptomyces olivaceus TaxID=47716 RepID=UPI001CCDF29B|nr:hypothetical protein [Streptomyces olivaceus]MBZ6135740.1 hypothetical protein [Streptomyces olivaceus]
MTTAAARARDTPGHAATPQPIQGGLFVDMENVRARYECLRPGCPQPKEGPVFGPDVKPFVDGIRTQHLAQYHWSTR